MIKVEKTTLSGVLKIQPDVFEDHRGQYTEIYNKHDYETRGIDVKFVQDDASISTKGVLRGIHGDYETWKLVSCLLGKIYLVVVSCDTESREFGKWKSFILTGENGMQILIPPNHGVAHLILSDRAVFHYKQSTYYNREKQFTYRWDDPRFGIVWPIKEPILSQRDILARDDVL